MATIKCNFCAVFAQFKSVKEVNEVANAIRSELINSYNARIKELGGDKKEKNESVTVTVSSENANTDTPTPKKDTKKSEKKEPKTAKKKEEQPNEQPSQIALTDTKAVKAMGFVWKDYSERSFVLSTDADTKCLKDALEALGGSWNGHLKGCGKGSYIFSKVKSEKDVKKAMKGLYKTIKAA